MDFNFDESSSKDNQNPTNNQKQSNMDELLNMDFQPFSNPNENPPKIQSENIQPIDDEEQKRLSDRKKEEEERKQKINEKIEKEEKLRQEIRNKATEYILEFEQKRQEAIALKRKELENKNSDMNNKEEGKTNSDTWKNINNNIDLKDSEYKGNKDVQRMKEAIMNRKNDENSEPVKNFFG